LANFEVPPDAPSSNPALGFEIHAEMLENIIERNEPRLAIGIFDEWGTGKTTLMQTIYRRLDREHILPVWFNPCYEKEQNLLVPLLDTLRDSALRWSQDNPEH
jgi:predicted KAP-like P-loop ATPase